MPMNSKFLTESTGKKIVKIGQYLAKIWTKNDSLVFFGSPCIYTGHWTMNKAYNIITKHNTTYININCRHMRGDQWTRDSGGARS